MCRSRKPGLRFSGSASEITDARQGELGFRVVPTAAPHRMKVGGNLWPTDDARKIYKLQYVIISADFDSIWTIDGKGRSFRHTSCYLAR